MVGDAPLSIGGSWANAGARIPDPATGVIEFWNGAAWQSCGQLLVKDLHTKRKQINQSTMEVSWMREYYNLAFATPAQIANNNVLPIGLTPWTTYPTYSLDVSAATYETVKQLYTDSNGVNYILINEYILEVSHSYGYCPNKDMISPEKVTHTAYVNITCLYEDDATAVISNDNSIMIPLTNWSIITPDLTLTTVGSITIKPGVSYNVSLFERIDLSLLISPGYLSCPNLRQEVFFHNPNLDLQTNVFGYTNDTARVTK